MGKQKNKVPESFQASQQHSLLQGPCLSNWLLLSLKVYSLKVTVVPQMFLDLETLLLFFLTLFSRSPKPSSEVYFPSICILSDCFAWREGTAAIIRALFSARAGIKQKRVRSGRAFGAVLLRFRISDEIWICIPGLGYCLPIIWWSFYIQRVHFFPFFLKQEMINANLFLWCWSL